MSCQPLVSIVTPSYNQGQFIEDTILSVRNQDYPYIEHIVIDGGSTDNTLDILRKYDGKITWISEKDRGQSDAVNKGFAMAKGAIIGWLNSDDLYFSKDTISNIVVGFQRFKTADLIYGDYIKIDENNLILQVYHRPSQFSYNRLLRIGYVSQPATFFRKKIIEKYKLDVGINIVMDLEFWLKIGRDKWNFRHLDRIVAAERLHKDAKCVSKNEEMRKEAQEVRERYGEVFNTKHCFFHLLDKLFFAPFKIKGVITILRLCSFKNLAFIPKLDKKLTTVLRQLNLL